jgi:hypothetical protein
MRERLLHGLSPLDSILLFHPPAGMSPKLQL